MGTVQLVNKSTIKSSILPLVWIFKYKYDNAGYLVKHKARLYVYGDLQKTELLVLPEIARQMLWWKRFFATIHFDTQQQMVIHYDNKQTL